MNFTEEFFINHKIVKKSPAKVLTIFSEIVPDFTEYREMLPSEYIRMLWSRYEEQPSQDNSVNGKILEYILITLLINKGMTPLYLQAKVAFVPNVDFDLLLYTQERPIAISVKTSLRERYKQADLEAIALKYVHRKAETYLLTLNKKEAKSVNAKIKTGDVIGLDKVIDAQSAEMDAFVSELTNNHFCLAGQIDIVRASAIVECHL